MKSPVLHVAGKVVLVNGKGQVLVLRESPRHVTNTKAGRYQLPGGRLEPGEAFFDGLKREVLEETGLSVTPGQPLLVGEWRPVVQGVPRQIIGMFLTATANSQEIRLSEEHDDYQWIDPRKRAEYDIVAPDCDAIDAYLAVHQP